MKKGQVTRAKNAVQYWERTGVLIWIASRKSTQLQSTRLGEKNEEVEKALD